MRLNSCMSNCMQKILNRTKRGNLKQKKKEIVKKVLNRIKLTSIFDETNFLTFKANKKK